MEGIISRFEGVHNYISREGDLQKYNARAATETPQSLLQLPVVAVRRRGVTEGTASVTTEVLPRETPWGRTDIAGVPMKLEREAAAMIPVVAVRRRGVTEGTAAARAQRERPEACTVVALAT